MQPIFVGIAGGTGVGESTERNDMMEKILRILASGGVIAAPTDTVYGLLADARNSKAVQKVYQIKGRQENNALPVFISDFNWLENIAVVNEEQKKFLAQIWPGKVTAILLVAKNTILTPNVYTSNHAVALRIPDYPLIREILAAYRKPLTGTSANKSGLPACSNAKCVKEQLAAHAPDYILDDGELPPSQPSTIVDLTTTPFSMIREGAESEKVKHLLKS